MKIVMIEGSPHKSGSSNTLANEFIRGAKENGHSVEIMDVAHMDINPCIGCEHCGMSGDCIHKDDNGKVKEAVMGADMLVFVTPIYYFGMSAQLKTVIDRFYSYTMALSGKGIKTALITAAWDSSPDVMKNLSDYYMQLCSYMHFQNQGMVLGTGCGNVSMTRGTKHMQAAYELGKTL